MCARRPGTLAKTYGELGGPVRIMGKPDRIIFDAALQTLGLSPDQVRRLKPLPCHAHPTLGLLGSAAPIIPQLL